MTFTIEITFFQLIYMPSFFQYSLASAICLAILLLPYLLWFRKTTFHQWNRLYLLGSVFFALSAPLLNITIKTDAAPQVAQLTNDLQIFKEVPELTKPLMGTEENTLSEKGITAYKQSQADAISPQVKAKKWDLAEWILLVYASGAMVYGGMFLYRLAKLFRLIIHGDKEKGQGFTSIHLPGKQVFSFFHFVFFDHDRYHENEKQTLLKHEQAHIQQWHSLDVLCLEVLQVVFWFDPLFRIYKKILQQEHEYFVDAMTSNGTGKAQYAKMLLNLATTKQPLLGHAFAYIPIKHRIFKLFQKPSTVMEKSKFLISLPFVLSLFLVFSCSVDGLEEGEERIMANTGKVKMVQAYFIDEWSFPNQEVNIASIEIDEDGTIANLDIKGHPVFGGNIPNSSIRKGYLEMIREGLLDPSIHNGALPTDFISRNAQLILAGDINIRGNYLLNILYHAHGEALFNVEKYISQDYGYEITELESRDKLYRFSGSMSKYKQRLFTKKEIKLNDAGQVINSVNYDKIVNRRSPIRRGSSRNVLENESSSMIEMKYSEVGLLQEINTRSSTEVVLSDGTKIDGPDYLPQGSLLFFYDERSNLEGLHIINASDILLRKYRFYYNEAGYCTKKECINREGDVEFSVRFDYEFYDRASLF
jgi:hypothetical protein